MSGYQKVELNVLGMACSGCSAAVGTALKNLGGVISAKVNLAEKIAIIEYDSSKLTIEDLKKAIQDAGYRIG